MRVKVLLQDTLVGQLAEIQGTTYFEFDGAFLRSNEALSPLHWPLAPGARPCRKRPNRPSAATNSRSIPKCVGRTRPRRSPPRC